MRFLLCCLFVCTWSQSSDQNATNSSNLDPIGKSTVGQCETTLGVVRAACNEREQLCTQACADAIHNAGLECEDVLVKNQLASLQETVNRACTPNDTDSTIPGPLANVTSGVGSYCRDKLTTTYDECLDQTNPAKACTAPCSLALKDAQPACSQDPVFGQQFSQITQYVNNVCKRNASGTLPQQRSACNLTQALCSPDFADIGPKWCRFNNPFIYVMNVSDIRFGSEPCFGSSCENNTGSLDLQCGVGPYGDCVAVTAITAAKVTVAEAVFAPVVISEESRLLTMIWMGHQSGLITVSMVAPFLRNKNGVVQQNLAVLPAHSSAVVRIATLDASPTFPTQALLLSSSKNTSKLWRVMGDAWPLPSFQLPCSTISHPEGSTLVTSAIFHSPSSLARFILLFRPAAPGPYILITGSVDFNQSFFRACPSVKQTLVTWYVNIHQSVQSIAGMQVFSHAEWRRGSEFDAAQVTNRRTIVMFYSSVAVSAFLLESDVHPFSPPSYFLFGDPQSPSTLFHASRSTLFAPTSAKDGSAEVLERTTDGTELKITTAEMVGEAFRRFELNDLPDRVVNTNSSEQWKAAQLVWLTMAVTIDNVPYLELISINEFLSAFDNANSGRFEDPANRGETWLQCASNTQWYNPEGQNCTNRRAYGVRLTGTSSRISVRYRDVPPDLKSASKWQELSQNIDRVPGAETITHAQTRCEGSKGDCQITDLSNFDSLTQLLSDPMLASSACSDYYQCLRSATAVSACPVLSQDSRSNLEKVLQNFLYFNIFVQIDEEPTSLRSHVVIFSMQAELGSKDRLLVEYDNELEFIGSMQDMYVSVNSLHFLAVVKRRNFDVDGTQRLVQLCERLRLEPDNIFLQGFKSYCEKYGLRPQFNVADFVWYASACPPGTYCPDFFDTVIYPRRDSTKAFRNSTTISSGDSKQELTGDFLPDGFYTLRTFELRVCEPGFFCMQGTRIACPIGFKCPDVGMQRPIGCGYSPMHNETCFHERPSWEPGLTEPSTCGNGQICIVSYLPGLPAPPGFAIDHRPNAPRAIESCSPGDWCVLGRSMKDNLMCPANTYCLSASVLTPTVCNFSTDMAYYCPEGTQSQEPCRAGSFCSMPNVTVNCSSHRYCPPGSFKAEACPGGYYCTTPSSSVICPSGSVCAVGSLFPRPCRFLSYCPEGSQTEGKSFAGVLALCAIFATPAILWQVCKRWKRVRHVQKRRAKRQVAPEQEMVEVSTVENLEAASPAAKGELYSSLSTPRASQDIGAPSAFIDVEFVGLCYQLDNGNKILSGLNGQIRHGELTGIMGPSGAGKTSLLSVLCDKITEGQVSGRMLINGKEEKLNKYKKLVGFVPQSDVMHSDLTVKENIEFSAATRLPAHLTKAQVAEQVKKVLRVLNLTKVKNQVVGDERKRGISGGQRKRVNIAMELVADPYILFLDEPTSGLDSTAAKDVAIHLRQIAQMGLTVVTCLHQPRFEIFEMLDRCMLLGFGGQMVYHGLAKEALDYFTKAGFECPPHVNPSDFFMDIISGGVPRNGFPSFVPADLITYWNEQRGEHGGEQKMEAAHADAAEIEPLPVPTSSQKMIYHMQKSVMSARAELRLFIHNMMTPATPEELVFSRTTVGLFPQIRLFFIRGLVQSSRGWQTWLFDVCLVLVAGLFLGLVYFERFYIGPEPASVIANCPLSLLQATPSPCKLPRDDPLPGQAAIGCISLALCACFGSLGLFGRQKLTFWRESARGVSTLAYFLGYELAHSVFIIIAPLCFTIPFYQLVSPLAIFAEYYGLILLMYWTASGWGYLVSIAVPPAKAHLFGVLVVLVNMMFSGANPTFSQLRVILGGSLLWLTNLSYIRWAQEAWYLIEIQYYQSTYDDIQTGMDIYEYKLSHLSTCIGVLFSIGCAVRVLAYLALVLLDRDKRK